MVKLGEIVLKIACKRKGKKIRLVNDDGYIMAKKTCEVCRSRHGMER